CSPSPSSSPPVALQSRPSPPFPRSAPPGATAPPSPRGLVSLKTLSASRSRRVSSPSTLPPGRRTKTARLTCTGAITATAVTVPALARSQIPLGATRRPRHSPPSVSSASPVVEVLPLASYCGERNVPSKKS
ncbi:hypothetical protein C8F04DRAFT_1397383, partial [Mycena alexandri]